MEVATMRQEFSCPHQSFILTDETKKDGEIHYCKVCKQRVEKGTTLYYSCKECCSNYVLHTDTSCRKPPLNIQHPLHPEHTLEFVDTGRSHKKCHNNCGKWFTVAVYKCSRCEFYLCTICAFLLPHTIKVISRHDHPLTLLRRSLSFTCDTCGIERKCMSYFCTTCSFMVDAQCAFFPRTLKVSGHDHPLSLNLKYSPQLNQYENQQICQQCVKKVNTKYKAYYCPICVFVAHPRAAKVGVNIGDGTQDDL